MAKISMKSEEIAQLMPRLRKLPKELNAEIRLAARAIAEDEAARMRAAGASSDSQSRLVAGLVRSRSDRVPCIVGGGAKKVGGRNKAPAFKIFFGAEFGGRRRRGYRHMKSGKIIQLPTTMQFRPHQGQEGYWAYPTLRRDANRMMARWAQAINALLREWGR